MNNPHTEESRIVAASPVIHESGMLPYRIVIRDLGDQHVVHTEVFGPGKEPWYHQGDYFPKRNDVPTAVESDAEALRRAWARFEERTRRSLRIEPPNGVQRTSEKRMIRTKNSHDFGPGKNG